MIQVGSISEMDNEGMIRRPFFDFKYPPNGRGIGYFGA
jgi:hypothetical protein